MDACGYVRDAGGLALRATARLSLACTFVVVLGYRLGVATTTRLSRCQRFRVGGSESITKLRTISQCVVLKIKWKENRNTLPVNYLAPSLPYTPDTEHLAILPESGAVKTDSAQSEKKNPLKDSVRKL